MSHAQRRRSLEQLDQDIVDCRACPRLLAHCREVADKKRRAYLEWDYWGRPVPNFGDSRARILIVGLAPGAHGANRTGRMFSGDRSGEWLYRALHRADLANQPDCRHREDGLQLRSCLITAACHCAPPQNRPSTEELAACRPFLERTMDAVAARVFVCLGHIAWRATCQQLVERQWLSGRRPRFSHGARVELAGSRVLLGCYHPSQQNTFTGRLTEAMLDDVFRQARRDSGLAD